LRYRQYHFISWGGGEKTQALRPTFLLLLLVFFFFFVIVVIIIIVILTTTSAAAAQEFPGFLGVDSD
jgi:hypothetical protein